MLEFWNDTQSYYTDKVAKRVYYMSIEFLMGRTMLNSISNLGLEGLYGPTVKKLGFALEELYEEEKDAGLGNGGLGRLAACFLDSMTTLNLPAWGYGIRYQYGMFKQLIVANKQVEAPDYWLNYGNPWEICRRDVVCEVKFGGYVASMMGKDKNVKFRWEGGSVIHAIAYDNPITGYGTHNTNNLRLWSSVPSTEFDLASFNREDDHADYWGELAQRQKDENICKVLYPNANNLKGQELRLKQQYFFSSASLHDIVRRFKQSGKPFKEFPSLVAIQLNDTHPAISISELMRILIDGEGIVWEDAWEIVTKTFAYTNHTVLPEALETWSVELIQSLLPRHIQIIYEINARFLRMVHEQFPDTPNDVISSLSIIEEGTPKKVRMANLAIIGSHTVNGVAALHSQILKDTIFSNFYRIWPDKFTNVTNGVTPRRWMLQCNPSLSGIITKIVGDKSWVNDLSKLSIIRSHISPSVVEEFTMAKLHNKRRLALYVEHTFPGLDVDCDMLFDVQVKRIHEYKRQILNALGIIARYLRIKNMSLSERSKVVPKFCLIGGKAAPGYYIAKLTICFINHIAQIINNDAETRDYLKVVFVPNYCVSLAEVIIPANDISQHISTAGTEASGTSNMKFVMNGGLLFGTLDGANIEIREQVGNENCFIFGAVTEEIDGIRKLGPRVIDTDLAEVINAVETGMFGEGEQFKDIIAPIKRGDDFYCVAHDFRAYLDCMSEVDKVWCDGSWHTRCANAVSGMGHFSSDRSISEYAKNIWSLEPLKVDF
jgi:starch phosphorylase